MRWKRVPKENCKQPLSGSYSDWKEILAEEGWHQCVYCAIPEPRFGGIRNFHVEHYRPKSIARFMKLRNDIRNLYFACAICNTFKGNDWPCEPDPTFRVKCFPDPSLTDYGEIFTALEDGHIEGRHVASRYVAERLFLNRPQLIYERRYSSLVDRIQVANEGLNPIIKELANAARQDAAAASCLGDLCRVQCEIAQVLVRMQTTPSYRSGDVSRR